MVWFYHSFSQSVTDFWVYEVVQPRADSSFLPPFALAAASLASLCWLRHSTTTKIEPCAALVRKLCFPRRHSLRVSSRIGGGTVFDGGGCLVSMLQEKPRVSHCTDKFAGHVQVICDNREIYAVFFIKFKRLLSKLRLTLTQGDEFEVIHIGLRGDFVT